jgi:hypothetical protein
MNVTLSCWVFPQSCANLILYRVPPARLILSSVFTIIAAINVGKWIADVDPRDWTMLHYW